MQNILTYFNDNNYDEIKQHRWIDNETITVQQRSHAKVVDDQILMVLVAIVSHSISSACAAAHEILKASHTHMRSMP